LLAALCCCALLPFGRGVAFALEKDVDDEDDQIAEGYEERRYALSTLTNSLREYKFGEAGFVVAPRAQLSEDNISEIIRTCVAPESWTKRGSARMSFNGGNLVVVQKKEVHDEISKVLQWLTDNVTPPVRTTVVAVSLKLETLRKLAAGGALSPADFSKVLEEAGDDGVDLVDLHGVEGQAVFAQASHTQTYVRDYDVSGAVYAPVVTGQASGLTVTALVYRNPDCATLQIDLSAQLASPATFDKARLAFQGFGGRIGFKTSTETKKDDKGKETTTSTKTSTPGATGEPINGELTIDQPTFVSGGLQTTLTAAPGQFTLAGTLDLSAPAATPGRILAIFVRASAGDGKVPTLTGASGLKEGESFRLYPLAAGQRGLPEFTQSMVEASDMATGKGDPAAVANAFMAPASPAMAAAIALKDSLGRAQKMFAEKVRKNKIVEEMGPVVFTRLVEADHARFLATLLQDTHSFYEPRDVHLFALALPLATYRKLLLGDQAAFTAPEIEALAANGVQVLGDSHLKTVAGQKSNVFAGERRSILADYEISGDSYDPVIHDIWSQAYAADVKVLRGAASQGDQVEVRFNALPGKAVIERTVVNDYNVVQGADMNVLMGFQGDLDKVRHNLIAVRATVQGAGGRYQLAGSAHMPLTPDGKADPRQAVLFVRVSDGK